MLVPIFLILSFITFSLIYIVPGDPVIFMLGERASQEEIATIRAALGLDKPIHIQYLNFLWRLLHGDMGRSIFTKLPVIPYVLSKLPATIELAVASLLIAVSIGIITGIISAIKQNSIFDEFCRFFSLFGISMPNFWLGLILIYIFSLWLRWLPPSGSESLRNLILPAFTLGVSMTATISRLTRSSMLEVLRMNYIVTARAKGLRERIVIYKHALRNALIPVITIVGLQFSYLLGGAFIVETIFAWPGMGRLAVEAMRQRDIPVVQGVLLIGTVTFVFVNLIVDILYMYIDPRVRYE